MSTPLPLAETIEARLEKLSDAAAELTLLESELAAMKALVDPRRWPHPGPARPTTHRNRLRQPDNGLTPQAVADSWELLGKKWLEEASRKDLRAAIFALHTPKYSEQFSGDAEFIRALAKRTTGRRLQSVISGAMFGRFPPKKATRQLAIESFGKTGGPDWWTQAIQPHPRLQPALKALAQLAAKGVLNRPGDLGLPPVFWESRWLEETLKCVHVTSIQQAEKVIALADGGQLRAGAPVSDAVAAALNQLGQIARQGGLPTRPTASLLVRRVGSPFDATADVRWRLVRDLLPLVRSWLAGQVLNILFRHLVPDDHTKAHMTDPRRRFWGGYTGRVRRLWILTPTRMRHRLDHPDVRKIRDMLGDALGIRTLRGQASQCIVWMHLDGSQGVVTAIEGNASTSLRLALGELYPPRGVVHYSNDIVHGTLRRHSPFVRTHDASRSWTLATQRALQSRGVTPFSY